MRRGIRFLSALLAVLALTGCWQEELPEREPASLVEPGEETEEPASLLPGAFSLPYAPDQSLDPIDCPDGMQQVVLSLVCEGLFRLDPGLQPEEGLCGGYTYDPEGAEYVFTLREGAVFSDGSPLTAADVRASLERARTSRRYGARLSEIRSVSARDGTVTVRLEAPNSGFPALLDVPISKSGGDGLPVGTGPYRFSREEGALCLTANELWRGGGGRPVDRISLVEAADGDAMRYRFSSHEVQLIAADLTGTQPFTATGRVRTWDAATTVLQFIGCNTAAAPLDDGAFRRLLWAGIDRDNVTGAFLSGHAAAAQFPVSPLCGLYPAELEEPYSRDAFAQAVRSSGYVPERTLRLLVDRENGFKTAVAQELAESFTEAGIPTEVQVLPWEEFTAALEAGDFDLYYGETRLTADWDLSALLAEGGALNFGGWADPRTEELIGAYRAAEDRREGMRALCAHLAQEAPILPVCFKSLTILSQAEVVEGGISTAAEPFYDLGSFQIHLADGG